MGKTKCLDGTCTKCGVKIKQKVGRKQMNLCIQCAVWSKWKEAKSVAAG